MTQKPEYERGYDDACRGAVEWLHRRAGAMNHSLAVQVLNSAATNLGWDTTRARNEDRRPKRFDNTDADLAETQHKEPPANTP